MLESIFNFIQEEKLSKDFDSSGIQSSFLFRSLYRARKIAVYLIDRNGDFSLDRLKELIKEFEGGAFPKYPDSGFDELSCRHCLKVLRLFDTNKGFLELLNKFKAPIPNRFTGELVRYSLNVSKETRLGTPEIRQAVFSALLTPLRQNIGSCFATAPAIFIQSTHLKRFLIDLYDLMSTCMLKRTFAGNEHVVPIATSLGAFETRKPIDFRNKTVFKSPSLSAVLKGVGLSPDSIPNRILTFEAMLKQSLYKKYGVRERDVIAFKNNGSQKRSFFSKPTKNIEEVLEIERAALFQFKAFVDHPLLRVWEYTLASFSDYKIEFFRWNLYTSLGLDQKDEGGIAHLLYQDIQRKLDNANLKSHSLVNDYNQAADEVNAAQTLLSQADRSDRISSLKAELESRLMHARACKELLDDARHRSEFYANFFSFLLKQYSEHFQAHFQEIYDPEMCDVTAGLYEDSPAGFRLVYKHGRKDPTLWTKIYDSEGYIKSLTAFFNATEQELISMCEWKEGEKEIREVTTLILHHLQTKEFLSSAQERMAKRYGASLPTEKEEKKPWSYTSGGTMSSLLSCYFCLESKLTVEERAIESPQDLLIFLIDTLKSLPPNVTDTFEKDIDASLLMESPNHAFLLKPGLSQFKEGWQDSGFTYTWVRDTLINPSKSKFEGVLLEREKQKELAKKFFDLFYPENSERLTKEFEPEATSLDLPGFRKFFLQQVDTSEDQIDTFLMSLYPSLPLMFADTNWGEWYFAFVLSPATLNLELWRFDMSGLVGFPMTSWKQWLDGSKKIPWKLYTQPKEFFHLNQQDPSWLKA